MKKLFFTAICMCIMLTSCQGLSDAAKESDQDQIMTEPYEIYMELYNYMHEGSLQKHIELYYSCAGDEPEFKKQDSNDYDWLFAKQDYALIDNWLSEIKKTDDSDDFINICNYTLDLMKTMDEAAEYGISEEYLSDDYAGAAVIHELLYPKLDSFEEHLAAAESYADKLSMQYFAEQQDEILNSDSTADTGESIERILAIASLLDREFKRQNDIMTENIDEINLDNIRPLYQKLKKQTEINKNSMDINSLKTSGFDKPDKQFTVYYFFDSADELCRCVEEMIWRADNKTPPDSSELSVPRFCEGSFEKYYASYCDMINAYNELNKDE